MDVVELDPKLTEIAYIHFNLPKSDRLNVFHEDARTFVNSSNEKYDAIMIDAFTGSAAIPFQLTTKEFFTNLDKILTDDGIVIMNTISSIEGPYGKFLRAEHQTFKSVFPYVYIFPVSYPKAEEQVQNIIIVASKKEIENSSTDLEIQEYLSHVWKKRIVNDQFILTDDFAPVEQFEAEMYN